MSYTKIEVLTMENEHVGYLANSSDWTTQAAVITGVEKAYLYDWVDVDGGSRLDQQTDGGTRSLTYSSVGEYPCWGLGANWVVVTHGDDGTVSCTFDKFRHYLARGKFNHGPQWSNDLIWLKDGGFDPNVFQKLKFKSEA
ncbi:hypothetical protein LP419_34485 [Massilia sp. H-1]|nr:hypothetical protein LP419_34485 [Massilia sp. H-1]